MENATHVAGRYRLSIVLCYAGFRIVYEISLERVIAHELFGRHRVTVVGGQSQLHNSSELTRAVHHSTYLVILSRIERDPERCSGLDGLAALVTLCAVGARQYYTTLALYHAIRYRVGGLGLERDAYLRRTRYRMGLAARDILAINREAGQVITLVRGGGNGQFRIFFHRVCSGHKGHTAVHHG